jgi:hypothetical protein
VIGRLESVSLPELHLEGLDAKIDTGAYSCSIHCDHIFIDENGDVHFRLLDKSHPAYNGKTFIFPVYEKKNVRSSNGMTQERIFIKTLLNIAGKSYKTEISLTNRKDMKYPMLLGRKFLQDRFIVDVSLTYQSSKA